jgi:Flp pilus assembly protein TadG
VEATVKQEIHFRKFKEQQGTVTVVVVLLLLLLIGFAAFAIDVGYMMVKRNELQNIADTAAIASAGELGAVYATMTYSEALAYAPASGPLLSKAQQVVNATALSGIVIRNTDFKLGSWNPATHTFTPASVAPTAVNVTVRKDNVANGPFSTLLAGVVGVGTFNVSATATASLTSLYNVSSGGLPLPVGISMAWFADPDVYCTQPIKLYPTNSPEGCAGWNVYEENPASASELTKILDGLTDGTYVSPETTAGITSYNFTGGTLTSVFDSMKKLFDTMKVKNDGVIDKDNDPNTWTTAVPVYDWPDCSNPNPRDGAIKVVGFSTIVIKSVLDAPEKTINAQVVCDSIVNGPGGGGLTLGTIGTIPNLVQ